MSTKVAKQSNLLLSTAAELYDALQSKIINSQLGNVEIDWKTGVVMTAGTELKTFLRTHNIVSETHNGSKLTDTGLLLLGRILIDLDQVAKVGNRIAGRYLITKRLRIGKNSGAFLARHEFLDRNCVIKLVRPGISSDLTGALKVLGRAQETTTLVHPIDFEFIEARDIVGNLVELACLVFPYVEGEPLNRFLRRTTPLSPYFFDAFIFQVGSALAALETIGAYHGDLHDENILVTEDDQGRLGFKVIDVSFGIHSVSRFSYPPNDIEQFRHHLWRSLTALQRNLPRMSLRKHLGARMHFLMEEILTKKNLKFSELLQLRRKNPRYERYLKERKAFLEEHFSRPSALGILRFEEITDQRLAVTLFEPYPELLENLKTFGNSMLFGHRGSGKSTYLAALAFSPGVHDPSVHPTEIFGVFFACRQGEFKQFSEELLSFDRTTLRFVKHIFFLKISRRVIHVLEQGVDQEQLRAPQDYRPIYDFAEKFIRYGSLLPYDEGGVSPLENLHAGLLRNEMREIHSLFSGVVEKEQRNNLGGERDLIEFFRCISECFPDLRETLFYILFDDAGSPNLPFEAQRVLNDFLVASNPKYCIKLSSERNAYLFEDSHGKALEEGHDFTMYDISRTLFSGGGMHPERRSLDTYFRKLVGRRLAHHRYASQDIADYLGEEPIPVKEIVSRLSTNRRNAYYCGWQVVWQLGDRTPRNVLEIVSELFAAGAVDPQDEPRKISERRQDRAIRRVSERKLKTLGYIPGALNRPQEPVGLGRAVFEFTVALGSVFRVYLTTKDSRAKRRRELLGIERNEFNVLSGEAQEFLDHLIRFGVLDDTKMEVARDDRMKKPIYVLNRIYCPAFGISFRRDAHLRLSKNRFEELLLAPLRFRRRGTAILQRAAEGGETYDLFSEFVE